MLANLELKYGLNLPWFEQLYTYVRNVPFHFDFVPSFKYKDWSVNDTLAQGFPVHGVWSFIVAKSVIIAVSAGIPLSITATV